MGSTFDRSKMLVSDCCGKEPVFTCQTGQNFKVFLSFQIILFSNCLLQN